ncbi:S8 family serine peptidase [Paenibacillus chibensis]|uniref:S8 family serine peptidase n=1 Tax=Paenibacillus chibensis TaxID=59846 RepID=UPI001FE3B8D1|nr:S8 family serine peptidase [Paenibacillus chibensis]MEC0372710.1 S8 family serine peptidase [Paenibacillus chibensis]
MKKGLLSRKLPIITLALGMTIGAVPGMTLASPSSSFKISNQELQSIIEASQPTYVSPQINTNSSKKVRVIIQLSGQPAAVGKYAAKQGISSLAKSATESTVQSQQESFLDEVSDQGIDLKVNYQYDTVLNGFEVSVPANEIPELAKIPGVKSIQENSTWYALPIEASSTGTEERYDINPLKQIGATDAWAEGYTGKGLKIGVIDTGVDYTHPDIAPAYKGGYDSFYNDNDPYEEVPLSKEDDPFHTGYEGTYHGTHVAGTIIGQYANKNTDIAQKGVAYGAELYAYKVLGRNLDDPSKSSGSSAQVIDGIERAVKDGMDVINLSLGSDSEKDVNSPDAVAINNAVLSGVVAVIANGNAGPNYYTMGSPATAQLSIAVGAVTSESKHYTGSLVPTLVDADNPTVTTATYSTYGELQMMGWETAHENFSDIVGTEPQEVVYVGLGDDKDYANKNVEGKIAFASRGTLAFVDKISNAKKHGAKAIVIFNGINKGTDADLSESIPLRDGFADVTVGDNFDFIPTFDMKGTEGRALARALQENPNTELRFDFSSDFPHTIIPGDELADFSSWGPDSDDNLSIKPDVTAPGVNILSTWPAYGKDKPEATYDKAYSRISGTSMATPHVAGLALLIKEAHPDWNPFDVRAALANTADILPDYDVYQQGAGRTNVINAIHTNALLEAVEPITILDKNFNPKNVINYNSSTSFGLVAPGALKQTKSLQLKNTGNAELTYEATIDWHGDHSDIEATLSTNQITAQGKKTVPFELSLKVGSNAKENSFYEGQVTLRSANQPELHLPFVVNVGKEKPATGFGIQEMNVSNTVVYPNRTTKTSTDLSFKLSAADTNYYEIDLVNLDDETIGFLDVQSTDTTNEYFKSQVYTLKGITNAYHPYDAAGNPVLDENEEPTTAYLKDGIYKIEVVAVQFTATGSIAKRPDGSKIIYSGVTSFRVDESKETSGGGNTGGGSDGSGNSGGGSSTSPTTPTTPSQPSTGGSANSVVEQGQKQVSVAPKTTTENGVTSATVTDADLKAAISSAENAATAVIIQVPGTKLDQVKVTLTADQIKQLSSLPSGSTIVVSAGGSAVAVPVSVLGNAPANAGFDLVIKKAEDQKPAFEGQKPGDKVIGSPVSIEAFWVSGTTQAPVQVSNKTFIKRSFTVPGSIEPNTAGVLFEENGKVTPISSVVKKQQDGSTIVTVNRPGFSVYAVVSRTVKFNDIASSPAASDITALANKLIVDGTAEGVFSPKSNLTRAEFTALLSRSLGLRSSKASSFTDVNASAWYANDLAAAYEAGLILGINKDQFAPSNIVTRQEMAVILNRALQLTGIEVKASNPSFSAYNDDAKVAPYAKDAVKSLASKGIFGGDGNVFNPSASVNRETAAAALHQLLVKTNLID